MYNCDKCGKIFNYNSLLQRHLNRKTPCDKNKTDNNNKKEYKCDKCLKTFRDSYILKSHKNKKNPCTNQIINSNNINNTNNLINSQNVYNIHINERMIASGQVGNNSFSLNDIPKMLNNKNIFKYLKYATLSEDYDKDDTLNNTKEIDILLKAIFFNVNIPENFIFFKDFLKDQIYIKINTENIQKVNDQYIIFCIYLVLNELKDNIKLDTKLRTYYKKYVENYKNGDFMNNETYKIQEFIEKIYNSLEDLFLDLSEDIKLLLKQNFTKLENKQKNYIETLKLNYQKQNLVKLKNYNREHNTNLFYDLKKIYEMYNEDIKNYNGSEDYEDCFYIKIYNKEFNNDNKLYINILEYFVKKYYFLNINNIEILKYVNNKFQYFNNNNWEDISDLNMHKLFVNEIFKELLTNKILISENNVSIDYDVIDSNYDEIKIKFKNSYLRYVLKYMISNKVDKINVKDIDSHSIIVAN
jgi:hypothetical protein